MRRIRILSIGVIALALAGLHSSAPAQELLKGEVKLAPRWRGVRHTLQLSAEQAHFRWAMPATISRRAFLGEGEDKPAATAALIASLCKQTGLTATPMGNVLVVHAANPDRLKELTAGAAGKDAQPSASRAVPGLAAICELGWLGDANALPTLAKIAVGDDLAAALAAAQALRRLEGQEDYDWRIYGCSGADPELSNYPISAPPVPWQMPLAVAFPGCVDEPAVVKLAGSQYIPLREAAARLAACLGAKGQPLAAKLAADPSLIVRTAAAHVLRAWAEPEKAPPAVPKKFDGKPWWRQPAPDLAAAGEAIRNTKDHDTVWRTVGRRVGYLGSPEAIKLLIDIGQGNTKWHEMVVIPLAEFNGGPEVVKYLQARAQADGEPWAMWGLSNLQDGPELAGSLAPLLEGGKAQWMAPPEFVAARWAGFCALKPLLARIEKRGHWVCLALGHVGGPEAVEALLARLGDKDAGVAIAAAKGLGDSAALAGVAPLIAQLKHEDRLPRHWAVLGLGRVGGPDAAKALAELLVVEKDRGDRLVRKAAAVMLREIGSPDKAAEDLIAGVEADDTALVPEYRPRNKRFDDRFPANTEVFIPEHRPRTYCSIGETRVVMDWANRLMIRYGGCTGCYSNECFAFDVGTGEWFPIRAASHFICWDNELRTNAGCSRGTGYDGLNKLVWVGAGIGMGPNPNVYNQQRGIGLSGYDAATDRFILPNGPASMPKADYSGEPHKFYAFDYDAALMIGSGGGGRGVGRLDVRSLATSFVKGPASMPSMESYPPPAFRYDPVTRRVFCSHPGLGWKTLRYDPAGNAFDFAKAVVPADPKDPSRSFVYDSLNRSMLLVGAGRGKAPLPICVYDRKADEWVNLDAKDTGKLGSGYLTVFDPEHNVLLNLHGGAYRYKAVPAGTKAFYGGGVGGERP